MLHVCGFSKVDLLFDFFRNPALKRLMQSKQIVYEEHFRVAVYFGKAPGFPEFGTEGFTEKCNTETINTKATHTNEGLQPESTYEQKTIDAKWQNLKGQSSKAAQESLLRPVYIDWNDWHSCEWCLYGDAMPAKCIRRQDPFNPEQYSFINYKMW